MALNIFVDVQKELVIHMLRGDANEAERFIENASRNRQPVRHILIDANTGMISVADNNGEVAMGDKIK
jgi:uncharacterized protein YbcI